MAPRTRRRTRVWIGVLALVVFGVPAVAAATAVAFTTLDRAEETRFLAAARSVATPAATAPTTSGPAPVAVAAASSTAVAGISRAGSHADESTVDPGEVATVQRLLLALGHDVGEVDGDVGPRTTAALVAVQQAAGLVPHGRLDPQTRAAVDRAVATVRDQLPASVVVDLSEQVAVVANAAGGQVAVLPVSTGAAGSETPTGTFAVVARLRVGQSSAHADVHMDYFTVFNGDIGFHGIPWVGDRDVRIDTPLGEAPASLGCIRMADEHAAWLYTFLPDGAPVVEQE